MKKLISLTVIALLAHCVAYGQTEEFSVAITGDTVIELSDTFRHFSISTSADIEVRFMEPTYNSSGVFTGWMGHPFGDPSVPDGSGPRPDIGDTLHDAYSALSWNIYNDTPAKRLNFTVTGGPYTVVVKAKK